MRFQIKWNSIVIFKQPCAILIDEQICTLYVNFNISQIKLNNFPCNDMVQVVKLNLCLVEVRLRAQNTI
jgi:hypothetical protein